jgi:macrolide-specific efflux system membrane fusion protein
MKRLLIIMLVLIVAASAGIVVMKKKKSAIRYDEVKPERGPIAIEFRETGSVSPRNRLEIKPQVQGRIESVLVKEGQKVAKGEIVAWMSSTERAALLDAARSQGADELNKWESVYKPTPIVAPLNGFIIARNTEPGQTVGLSDIILVMADTLIIEANIDETDLRYIHLGQRLSVFLDAYPDKTFRGDVEHIAYESQIVNNVTVYAVKIRPVELPAHFRTGMTATIDVKVVQNENALLVPSNALTDKNGQKSVLIKTAAGKPESRQVQTGTTNGRKTEIISGVTDTDMLLIPLSNGTRSRNDGPRMGLPGMGGGRR